MKVEPRSEAWSRCALAGLLCLTAGVAPRAVPAAEPVKGPLNEGGMVAYLQQQSVRYLPLHRWPGVRAKTLSEDASSGRLAAYAEFGRGWTGKSLPEAAQSIDIVILDGSLDVGGESLGPRDFAFVPPGAAPPTLHARATTHALLFFDPAAPDAAAVLKQREHGAYITRFDPSRWDVRRPCEECRLEHGSSHHAPQAGPLHDGQDLVRNALRGMTTPWEVHSMIEEGYLVQGGYKLAECLPDRTVIGDYGPGGYFWRRGGIPHSGPDSAPRGEVIWLQRSPVALDVAFYQDCRAGKAEGPLLH